MTWGDVSTKNTVFLQGGPLTLVWDNPGKPEGMSSASHRTQLEWEIVIDYLWQIPAWSLGRQRAFTVRQYWHACWFRALRTEDAFKFSGGSMLAHWSLRTGWKIRGGDKGGRKTEEGGERWTSIPDHVLIVRPRKQTICIRIRIRLSDSSGRVALATKPQLNEGSGRAGTTCHFKVAAVQLLLSYYR